MLRSEPVAGRIVIDSETTLSGVPPEAWAYRLVDHKDRVIDLLARVVRISVETLRLVDELKAGPRS